MVETLAGLTSSQTVNRREPPDETGTPKQVRMEGNRFTGERRTGEFIATCEQFRQFRRE